MSLTSQGTRKDVDIMKIYVVMGTTGEYSDRTEWGIVAYTDEKKAQEHVDNATRRSNELYATVGRYEYRDIRGQNEFDPDGYNDYTGNSYYLLELDLIQ